MRSFLPGAAASLLLLVSPAARADEPVGTQVDPGPTPTCRLGDHAGIPDADAQTAGQLVCSEIARAGAPVGARYRVSLGKLGYVIIYSVAREGETPGSTADSREMRLHGIEEASVAAPRLADSIVHGTTLADTEKVDNLVGEETRKSAKKPGSTHFSLGIIGNLPPLDQGIGPAPGISLHVHYETKWWELGGGLRFGGGQVSNGSPTMGFFMASVGGRYFLNDTDFSPYIGGGLAWDYLQLNIPTGFSGSNSGLGTYADAGVEFLRTYHTHISAGVRFDVPFFSLNNNTNNCASTSSQGAVSSGGCVAAPSYYYWPVSLEVRLTF